MSKEFFFLRIIRVACNVANGNYSSKMEQNIDEKKKERKKERILMKKRKSPEDEKFERVRQTDIKQTER